MLFFSHIQQHLLECERCRHAYHPACLGPSYPTRATRKRRHWVRAEAHAPCFGVPMNAAITLRLALGQGSQAGGDVGGPFESLINIVCSLREFHVNKIYMQSLYLMVLGAVDSVVLG